MPCEVRGLGGVSTDLTSRYTIGEDWVKYKRDGLATLRRLLRHEQRNSMGLYDLVVHLGEKADKVEMIERLEITGSSPPGDALCRTEPFNIIKVVIVLQCDHRPRNP